MKLSLNWLSDHVDLDGISPQRIADELTMKTALIEEWERPAESLQGVNVLVCHRFRCKNR